ncbi:MAG: hypothetical protein HRF45_09595 [Fimbriimonadia bacterium]
MSRPKLAGIIVVAGLALAGLGTYIGMRKFRLYQEHWQCWSELDDLGSAMIFGKRVPDDA